VAGLIAGSTGAGGGFVVTPALMSLGIKGILAVGTDMLYLFANGLIGTAIHRKLGNVNVRLAIAFTVGSMTGVTVGGMANRALFELNPVTSDLVISLSYVVILGFLGFYALNDFVRTSRSMGSHDAARASTEVRQTPVALAVRSVRIPPLIRYDAHMAGGKQVSAIVVVLVGLVVGFVAAVLGAGGGFLTFPIFVYGLGISTLTTTGTNILQVLFTAGYGAIGQYAIHGYVIYSLAIAMMLGSLVGVQIGALGTRFVSPALIRGFYAVAILAGFVNRLFAVPEDLSRLGVIGLDGGVARALATVGSALFFALVTVLAVWILGTFVRSVPRLRAQSAGVASSTSRGRLVRRPRAFRLGIGLLVSFYTTVVAMSLPLSPSGQTALAWADGLFNSVSKGSAWFVPEEAQAIRSVAGERIDVTLQAPDAEEVALWARLYGRTGATVQTAGAELRVTGDLDAVLLGASSDAELAYANAGGGLRDRHGADPRAVTHAWWSSLKLVDRALDEQGHYQASAVVKSFERRVLEPAHNYYGTERKDLAANAGPVAGVLMLYLVFAVWYGGAIYALGEAFGIVGKGAPQAQPSRNANPPRRVAPSEAASAAGSLDSRLS
jgi:uncharacterized protein